MMTSYFNLLKYAATGIASPDMTYYDKLRASTLMGGAVQTLTGQPPLSFNSNGAPLISWSMKGNGSQTGTPTPDNPVMPEFVGVRTGNLYFKVIAKATIDSDGKIRSSDYDMWVAEVVPGETYSMSKVYGCYGFFVNEPVMLSQTYNESRIVSYEDTSFTVPQGVNYVAVRYAQNATYRMLNVGSQLLPYEPYGCKIPLTCAGQTTPVYLGEVPTVRAISKVVFNGSENWSFGNYPYLDNFMRYGNNYLRQRINICMCSHLQTAKSVRSGDPIENGTCCFNIETSSGLLYYKDTSFPDLASFKSWLQQQYAAGTPVTLWYVLATPEVAIVNEPLAKIGTYADELHSTDAGVTIPTANGANTLTVETDLQPSEISITYRE